MEEQGHQAALRDHTDKNGFKEWKSLRNLMDRRILFQHINLAQIVKLRARFIVQSYSNDFPALAAKDNFIDLDFGRPKCLVFINKVPFRLYASVAKIPLVN